MATRKGTIPWNKGLKVNRNEFPTMGHFNKHTEGTKERISLNRKNKASGEKNGEWKGDNVSYRNLHRWVERKLGKAIKCMNDLSHKSTRFHWANISKEYKRELSDWIQLCPSCNCSDRIGRRVSP